MRQFIAVAFVLLAVVAGAPLSAATVQNGSFEDIGTGSLNSRGWNLFSSIPNWTGAPNVEVQSDRTLRGIDAQDGSHYVELDTNRDAGIFQDITLEVGRYALSFWYSPRVNAAPTTTNDMYFGVMDLGDNSTLVTGGVNGAPNPAFPHGVWTPITALFEVTDKTIVRLSLFATGGSHDRSCGHCGALIDNVQLTTANSLVTPMPLPAGVLFLLTGLAGFALWGRRRAA